MQIQQAPSPNFKAGRKGRKIIAIVNHITAGLMPGTLSWLRNPDAKASAHYLITKKGEIYQLVKDEDTAWHAGIVDHPDWALYDGSNPNYYTVGIEHEALAGEPLNEEQYRASLWLHQQLIVKWGIPIDINHIIGHYRIDSINRRNDPGPRFPWDRLFRELKGEDEEVLTPVKVVLNGAPLPNGFIIQDHTYVPVRAIAEALGAKVSWDAVNKIVVIQK